MWGVYKRHTPFAMITEKINIQDNCIRIPRRGDLLSYMYLMRFSKSTGLAAPWDSSIVNSWKLFIGQELIDTQDSVFSLSVAPGIMARTYARSTIQNGAYFCPIQFWFCNDLPLPLVALQYDDVTIRMDWTPDPGYYYECYFNFVLLAEEERQWFASTAHEISIYQVNKLTNTSDVVLRNPVNFIASDPIKLPTTFQYGITINGKQLRTMYNSHGAQLYAQTDTSRILPATSDPYPPIAMSTDTQAIVTPYSIGTFSIVVSGNTQTSYAFNLHDGNPATFWTTPGQTVASQTVTYTAAASSNVSNAWMAFDRQGNTWVSGISTYTGFDPTTSGIYVANSNQVVDNSNAWLAFDNNASTYWNSNTLYGNQYSKYAVTHTVSASSNLVQQPEYLAVDGNTSTFFTSNPGAAGNIYYLDMLGTYTMNASSSNTKIEFAFDGSPSTYWESNAYGAYGVTVAQGTYTSSASSTQGGPGNEYLAFDPSIAGTAWQSLTSYGSTANVTTSFTVSASSNLSPGTEYTVLTGGSWSSNTQNSTYGYSTLYGNYASNSSYNLATSYLPFSTSGIPSNAINLGNGILVSLTGSPSIFYDVSGYAVIQYTNGGTFQIYNSGVPVNVLVVGGGGGGGFSFAGRAGGAGGGGGVVFWPNYTFGAGVTVPVSVGGGGPGGDRSSGATLASIYQPTNGGSSQVGTILADGGGAGSFWYNPGPSYYGPTAGGYGGSPNGGQTQGQGDGSTGSPYGFGGASGGFNGGSALGYSFSSTFGQAYNSGAYAGNIETSSGGWGTGGAAQTGLYGQDGANGVVILAVRTSVPAPIGWSSNSVYGNTWTRGTYTIQASSNVTPTWNISNWFQTQPFVSGNIYGYSVPLGTYGANASPLSSPTVAWQAFAGTGWGTASNYGANTVTGATFTFSSSRGTGTEWQPFNQTLGGSWNPGVGYYGSNTFTAAAAVASLTQGTTTTSSIQLSFALASGATGYVITTNPATSSNVTTTSPYTFNGLTSGQSYIFYVTSWNLAGQGGTQSNTFITISPAVTGFSVILGQASVSSVTLQWNASYGAATYNITSSPASSPTTQSTSGTSLTVTGLPNPGTNYTFTIVAINSGGTSSNTTTMAYTAPGAATLTQGTTTANSMTVSWTAVTTATSYNVTASGADGSYSQNLGVTGTSTTLTGLNPGVQYTVQITTLSSAGTGATSTSSFTTAPDVVTGLTVTSSPNITSLTVAWSNAATATSYLANIYYSNGTFVSSQTVSTTNAATFTGLTANTNYYVIITSKSAVGTGNTTGQLSTGTGPSTTVTSLTQTAATTSSLTATFSANGGTNFASSLYDTNNNLVASSVSTSLSVTFGGLGISSGFTLKVAQVNASGYVGNPVSLVCTTGFILDQLSSTSYSALYSLYRVTYAYAGPVFRLTNAAQTSQQDFYAWVDKTLWTSPNGTGTSVASWIAANGGTGYMRTWYDQSGLALHATQTTASLQPIYSNSRVDMTSGAYFNLPAGAIPYGVSQYTVTCKLPTVPSPLSTNVIYCGGTNSGTGSLNGLNVNSSGFTSWWNYADATAVVTPGANYVVTNMFQYNNTRTIWVNNSRFYYSTSDIARQNAGNASSPNFIGYSNYFGALYGTLAYISFFNAPLGTSDRNIVESQ